MYKEPHYGGTVGGRFGVWEARDPLYAWVTTGSYCTRGCHVGKKKLLRKRVTLIESQTLVNAEMAWWISGTM